jgi:hypothetical protein
MALKKTTRMANGRLSPKTLLATVVPLVVGLVVMVLDLTGIIDVDDSLWLGLLGITPVVGGAAWTVEPGETVTTVKNEPVGPHQP